MKKYLIVFILSCSLAYSSQRGLEKAVTYTFSGGRFGDCLLPYMHALWVSYRYNIPLLYKPFDYSDQLTLHDQERLFNEQQAALLYRRTIYLGFTETINPQDKRPLLYVVPYFPECAYEHILHTDWPYIEVDFEDAGFRALLKERIKPKNPPPPLQLPEGRICVAAHVRRGGGFDRVDAQITEPLRFPRDKFYYDQIRRIYNLSSKQPLHVHIFTDDKQPETIAQIFKEHLQDVDVTFSYRVQGNHHASYVLEDFFNMMQFECLIRPESNFSRTCAYVHDFKIEIYPVSFYFDGPEPKIDQIETKIREF